MSGFVLGPGEGPAAQIAARGEPVPPGPGL